ncbi:MAG: hypothetical protein OEU26_22845 [Candidatus Tectomicrobia bacterium]|nr:hypothetical protein [Candidatus Tectomicrobia bacterium]
MHFIVVRDFGTAGEGCDQGGGYDLDVKVKNATGERASQADIKLGGGPVRLVPEFALGEGAAPNGPLLDDEDVPNSTSTSSK